MIYARKNFFLLSLLFCHKNSLFLFPFSNPCWKFDCDDWKKSFLFYTFVGRHHWIFMLSWFEWNLTALCVWVFVVNKTKNGKMEKL
jgi:hypothetical protein